MTPEGLKDLIASGEDSGTQFQAEVHDTVPLAAEMAAFANALGGQILLGVTDRGDATGLDAGGIQGINQLIETAASLVKSPLTVHTENLLMENGRVVIVLTVQEGVDKPYFDKNGVIWLKNGADKRQVNSIEEFRLISKSFDPFLEYDPSTNCENEHVAPENETVEPKNETAEAENETVHRNLTPLQVQLVNLIRSNTGITYDEMEEATGKSRTTVWRHLNTLREKGVVRRVGSDRHGHWEIEWD